MSIITEKRDNLLLYKILPQKQIVTYYSLSIKSKGSFISIFYFSFNSNNTFDVDYSQQVVFLMLVAACN